MSIFTDDDPSYQAFLADCARSCRCCRECGSDIPCAGVMAGGLCDEWCTCDKDWLTGGFSEPYDDDGYDSDYEDQP